MAKIILFLPFFLLLSVNSLGDDHVEDGDPHHDSLLHLGTIEVLGEMGSSDLLKTVPTVSNLHGEELLQKNQSSLGEALKDEAGINSTQFGPAASRPVIRGLEGDRIRILQNGIGVLDASSVSQDHAVPVSPLVAESVEVVRGPINLLYGSSAIGGVVNIVTSRIHKRFFEGLYSGFDLKHESVNQGQNFAGKMDCGIGRTMIHVDGHYLKTENTDTPLGPIANSEMEQHSLAAGVTLFTTKKDSIGVSYSTFQNIYGVVSDPDVDINLKQNRIDLAGSYKLNGFFKSLQFKSAQNFYEHIELEGGETGTIFENSGNETRIELVQNNKGPFSGVLGLQGQVLEFSALGDEAFLPTTDHSALALFFFEEYSLNSFKFNGGVRGEFTQLKAESGPILATAQEKDFNTMSLALGGLYAFNKNLSTTLNVSLNQRAPNYQEMFANGPHLAVGIFEQGNQNLGIEKSTAIEWALKLRTKSSSFQLNLFNQDFSNFISLSPTGVFHDTDESGTAGDSADDFEINNYASHRARINGIEFQSTHQLPAHFDIQLVADYLYGQNLDSKTPLPRISPIRAGITLSHSVYGLRSALEWRNVFKQTRTAPLETATGSYNLLNLNVNYQLSLNNESMANFYFQANNLTDEIARNHVSIIKDKVLLPGRNFVLGARLSF